MSNNDYVVGRAYGEMAPNQSAIYEALLEKANRDLAEACKERDDWKRMYEEADWKTVEAETFKRELEDARRERNKWGLYGEKMQQERDYYKQALEEISTTIQEYKDSLVQEPSEDFIAAIKAWADKKLNEL